MNLKIVGKDHRLALSALSKHAKVAHLIEEILRGNFEGVIIQAEEQNVVAVVYLNVVPQKCCWWKRSHTALWLGERAGMRSWRRALATRWARKSLATYSGPLSLKMARTRTPWRR